MAARWLVVAVVNGFQRSIDPHHAPFAHQLPLPLRHLRRGRVWTIIYVEVEQWLRVKHGPSMAKGSRVSSLGRDTLAGVTLHSIVLLLAPEGGRESEAYLSRLRPLPLCQFRGVGFAVLQQRHHRD